MTGQGNTFYKRLLKGTNSSGSCQQFIKWNTKICAYHSCSHSETAYSVLCNCCCVSFNSCSLSRLHFQRYCWLYMTFAVLVSCKIAKTESQHLKVKLFQSFQSKYDANAKMNCNSFGWEIKFWNCGFTVKDGQLPFLQVKSLSAHENIWMPKNGVRTPPLSWEYKLEID